MVPYNSCKLNAQLNCNINTYLKQKSMNIGGMHQGLPSVSSVLADSSTGAGSVSSSITGSTGSSVHEHV
jgi:hypothetical protein